MAVATPEKGKSRAVPESEEFEEGSSTSSGSGSDSDSDVSSDSDDSESEEEITEAYLESLLEQARQNAAASSPKSNPSLAFGEEDVIKLGEQDEDERPLPSLDPGSLPTPYIQLATNKKGSKPSKVRDLDAEYAEKTSASAAPKASVPPPSALPTDKQLTKKEKKAARNKTAGPSWFDLPAPAEADLPKLYREVEAMRLRNQLDPKRFYRKEAGEGKGIKGLPKHFAIGTIVAEPTPFGKASADNLSRSHRKRTLVDELVDDAEAKSYAKKKFKELQSVRGAKGRGTLAQRQAKRKPKW